MCVAQVDGSKMMTTAILNGTFWGFSEVESFAFGGIDALVSLLVPAAGTMHKVMRPRCWVQVVERFAGVAIPSSRQVVGI